MGNPVLHTRPARYSPQPTEVQVAPAKQIPAPYRGMAMQTQKLQTTHILAATCIDMTSPVMRSGCYEFDRVIKSAQVMKRTRKTKSWRTVLLVLRPGFLSIYKDVEGTQLRNQITLSDLTAIARQRDPKRKGHHVFGLFSPSRNYHIEAASEQEAQEWVELIRREARMDADADADDEAAFVTREPPMPTGTRSRALTIGSSSEEQDFAVVQPRLTRPVTASKDTHGRSRRPSHSMVNFSGNEGSLSEFSDVGQFNASVSSFSNTPDPAPRKQSEGGIYGLDMGSQARREVSGSGSNSAVPSTTDDRVVYQGWLYLLKSHHGVRQWRSVWGVMRPKSFAVYKNEEEYSATLVVPFSKIQDAVDCDALSKTKTACLQLITLDKNYRFCAMNEDELARWLGSFKSLLARRRDGEP